MNKLGSYIRDGVIYERISYGDALSAERQEIVDKMHDKCMKEMGFLLVIQNQTTNEHYKLSD